jgi:hypothetical protein
MEQRRVELEARQVESAVGALGRAQEAEMLREAASTIDHYHQAQEQIRLAAEAEKARAVSFSEAIARSLLAAANDSPAEAASPSSLPAKGKSHHAAVGALSAHHDEPPRASDAELLSLQAALAPPAAPTGLPQRKPTTVAYGPALTYIGEVTVSSRGSAAALKHGRGQMFYDASRTTFYDGQWADDEKSGFGTMSLPHSLVEGEWRRNKLHGRSTLQTSKLKASLQLQQGQPSGNILAELDTGSTFAGRVVPAGDRPQAVFGTLRLTSADTAEWMWQDPRAPGTGDAKVHFASGDSYVGAVQGYVLHGHGAYHFTEGHEYIGEFHRGAMTGRGVFRFQSGNVYEGTLRGGVFHGTGKYSQQQEYVYEGEWVEGRMHGRGVVKYRNGDVWEGVLENDKRVKGRYVSSRVFQLPPS